MCYLMFATNAEHLIPVNVKHFWSYIKNLKKDSSLPSPMKNGEQVFNDSGSIANAFASHFQSCYSNYNNLNLPETQPVNFFSNLASHYFTLEDIGQKIRVLDATKKSGPDGVPPILLKNCCSSLMGPLCILFQKSLDNGLFPSKWKYSNLVPVLKSGDKSDIKNYRGISILSAIPKLLESIITDEIFNTFKHYIIAEQHGFYKGRSTATNLGVYQDFLVSSVEAGKQVDVIYTDLSKAFDSVCHPLLLKKLSEIGISGNYLKWVESYLFQRRQRVTVCGSMSSEVSVFSGVPQGSHIGPVLFLLFINDVLSCFKVSRCLLYADDLKFYSTVDSGLSPLQSDLDRLVNWCDSNYLKLNVNKCKTVSFYKTANPITTAYSINNVHLESVSSFNDLGVTFNKDLSFKLHIGNIVLKGLRLLGFIKRNTKHINDTKALLCLYNCLVRSTLEYCSVIWSPCYACHISRIEQVQNKFAKYLLYKYRFPYQNLAYETRLLLCGLESLERRRKEALLFFLFKLLNGITDCDILLDSVLFLAPIRRTRQSQLFFERTHRTNYGLSAFTDRLVNNYNMFFPDLDIFHLNLHTLKNVVKA